MASTRQPIHTFPPLRPRRPATSAHALSAAPGATVQGAEGHSRLGQRVAHSQSVRLLWCALGASAGIALALSLAGPPLTPFLLASLGGSATFLFGLTRLPAAQPRALIGGHIGAALVGIACYHWLGDSLYVYALAEALALGLMLLTGTVHPPAGANPLIMIYCHAGFAALWAPVLVGVVSLAVVAAVWSRLFPGLVHYPTSWWERSPRSAFWGGWPE